MIVRSIKTNRRYFTYNRYRDIIDPDIENILFYINKDGTEALYLQEELQNLFIKRIHKLYSYLGYPGLLSAIDIRV